MSRYSNQIDMAMDAMRFSTKEILSRAFDDVKVLTEYNQDWDSLKVTVHLTHRGRALQRHEEYDARQASDPDFYCEYLREQMPRKVAHAITDFILRENIDAPRQESRRTSSPQEFAAPYGRHQEPKRYDTLCGQHCAGCNKYVAGCTCFNNPHYW